MCLPFSATEIIQENFHNPKNIKNISKYGQCEWCRVDGAYTTLLWAGLEHFTFQVSQKQNL